MPPGQQQSAADDVRASSSFTAQFLAETSALLAQLPPATVEKAAAVLAATKGAGGRVFFCGSGGGAGHASHAAADFRKLVGIECYSVTDNVSELTARVNDEGWDTSYAAWLKASRLGPTDCLFVFSVGGGDAERGISTNLVRAMHLAKEVGARVVGVAGRDGGELARVADAAIVIPMGDPATVTAQTEGLQAVLWHLLASHPALAPCTPKWESVTR